MQLSNLLFWMFLHTPLTLIERHGHRIKDFPEPPSDAPLGVDATVAEGWLDLRVRNDTEITFQITVTLEGDAITGRVSTDRELGLRYEAVNENLVYTRQSGAVYRRGRRGAAGHGLGYGHLRVHPEHVPESM